MPAKIALKINGDLLEVLNSWNRVIASDELVATLPFPKYTGNQAIVVIFANGVQVHEEVDIDIESRSATPALATLLALVKAGVLVIESINGIPFDRCFKK